MSGGEGTFEIDSVSGVISRKHGAAIDYELMSVYNLTVGCSACWLFYEFI